MPCKGAAGEARNTKGRGKIETSLGRKLND